MIVVKVNNGVVGWVKGLEAALACMDAGKTALGGFGSIWTVEPPLRNRMGVAVKWIKDEIEARSKVRVVLKGA